MGCPWEDDVVFELVLSRRENEVRVAGELSEQNPIMRGRGLPFRCSATRMPVKCQLGHNYNCLCDCVSDIQMTG